MEEMKIVRPSKEGTSVAAKNEGSEPVPKVESMGDSVSITSFDIPRTISPIGLFFGHGAPDPRNKTSDESNVKPEEDSSSVGATALRMRRAPVGTPITRVLISMGVMTACGLFYLIILRIPLDPSIVEFWVFLIWLCVVFTACMFFLSGTTRRVK